MRKPKWPRLAMAVVLLVTLLAGMSYFAGVRAPASYPEMSSLNSGPQGTKLLFDALSRMPPLTVSRNYLPFSQWHPVASTILLLSVSSSTINSALQEDLVELETLARANNRVVICVPDDSALKKPSGPKNRWGIQIYKKDKDSEPVLDHDATWQPVDGIDDAVEKHFDRAGMIIVAMHSDDFSNDSLATDASFLDEVPPVIGPHTAIVFDETHLGVEESGSIAGLARRYQLQGLVMGLLILVALFIWNRSVSFPPPAEFEISGEKQVQGANARTTFAGLISRHLTPQALVESCVAEWNRVKPQQRISTAAPIGKIDPVAAYRQLQENLPKRRSRI